jgi:1L-myo-inositol 1-phosphate cytidylyltransferase / CDP-L-myo-inositol myo-inositolphosphotransferase
MRSGSGRVNRSAAGRAGPPRTHPGGLHDSRRRGNAPAPETVLEGGSMAIDDIVVLAAGFGSRLSAQGDETYSKPLLRVGGRPLLQRTLASCARAGMRRALCVVGYQAEHLRREVGGWADPPLRVEFVHNAEFEKPNGLSLYVCRDALRGPFALTMADHLFDWRILAELCGRPLRPGTARLAVDPDIARVYDLDDATKVRRDGAERIVAIGKHLDPFDAADCGLFACTEAVFGALEEAQRGGRHGLADGMRVLAERGCLDAMDVRGRAWQDVDTPEMLALADDLARKLDNR